MVKILSLIAEDLIEYNQVFEVHKALYGDPSKGLFYKYIYNDEENILYRENNIFVVYSYSKDDYLCYQSFTIDDEYNINKLKIEDYMVDVSEENYLFTNLKTNLTHRIQIIKRNNDTDIDGYNAIIAHSQYSYETNTTSLTTYQYNISSVRNKNCIYSYHLKNPFQITLGKGIDMKHKKTYLIRKSHPDDTFYNLIAIKDYGILEFLKRNSYTIQKESEIVRYYRMIGKTADNYAITLFPFCPQYKIEDLEELLVKNGHVTTIPEEIIEFYNEGIEAYQDYQEIAKCIKEIELEISKSNLKPIKLVMKKGECND